MYRSFLAMEIIIIITIKNKFKNPKTLLYINMIEEVLQHPNFKGFIRQTKNNANYVTIPKQYINDGHFKVNLEYRWFAIPEIEYQKLKNKDA